MPKISDSILGNDIDSILERLTSNLVNIFFKTKLLFALYFNHYAKF